MNRASGFRGNFVLFFLSLVLCLPALARTSPAVQKIGQRPMPEMLSYYELMRLNQQERDVYIQEVVSLMRYLEDRENGRVARLPAPSKTRLVTDLWALLLRGETVSAVSCPTGLRSITVGGQQHCVEDCKKGTQNAGVSCSINFKDPKASKCARNCVAVSNEPSWVLPVPEGSGIAGPDGVIRGHTTPKTGRTPGSASDPSTAGQGDKNPADLATAERPTQEADNKKPAPSQDACYEIACPSGSSEYRFTVKDDFNRRVTETKDQRCINAGMVGKYDIAGRKKCLPVQKFKIGSLDLSCSAGTTMCNPLLFGLEKNEPAAPYCIPIGLEMTQQCYQKAAGAGGAREFWKNPSVTHEVMAEEWDKIVKHLREDLCTEERSAKYHCLECALIAKRIAELNKMVDGCPKANKCGDEVVCASRWKDVKGLESGETHGGSEGAGSATQR